MLTSLPGFEPLAMSVTAIKYSQDQQKLVLYFLKRFRLGPLENISPQRCLP